MKTALHRLLVLVVVTLAGVAGLPVTQANATPAVRYTNPIAAQRAASLSGSIAAAPPR